MTSESLEISILLVKKNREMTDKEKTLNNFEDYLRTEGQRLSTVRGNSNSSRMFLDWVEQEQINYLSITYTDLLAYINYYKARGNSKSTINGKLQGIKHFYNYLQQKELVAYNPAEELRIKNVIIRQPHDLLEWEVLEEIYHNYPTNNVIGKRNKVILGMMIYQGLNSGELAAIELKDVKLEEATVYISSVSRSNSRTLKLESLQILSLQKYITQIRLVLMEMKGDNCKSDSLFVSSGLGSRLDNSLTGLMKRVRKINPNIKNPKQIRASVITYWLKVHKIRQVQYLTGHRYVSSTERYGVNLLDTLQDQINELHPFK